MSEETIEEENEVILPESESIREMGSKQLKKKKFLDDYEFKQGCGNEKVIGRVTKPLKYVYVITFIILLVSIPVLPYILLSSADCTIVFRSTGSTSFISLGFDKPNQNFTVGYDDEYGGYINVSDSEIITYPYLFDMTLSGLFITLIDQEVIQYIIENTTTYSSFCLFTIMMYGGLGDVLNDFNDQITLLNYTKQFEWYNKTNELNGYQGVFGGFSRDSDTVFKVEKGKYIIPTFLMDMTVKLTATKTEEYTVIGCGNIMSDYGSYLTRGGTVQMQISDINYFYDESLVFSDASVVDLIKDGYIINHFPIEANMTITFDYFTYLFTNVEDLMG